MKKQEQESIGEPVAIERKPVEVKPDAERLTPREWAQKLGHITAKRLNTPDVVEPTHPFYAAADALHGWTADAHHNQGAKAFKLTQADYLAALKAAAEYPCVPAHGAAITPSCPIKHEGFKPRKRAKRKPNTQRPKRRNWRPVNEVS